MEWDDGFVWMKISVFIKENEKMWTRNRGIGGIMRIPFYYSYNCEHNDVSIVVIWWVFMNVTFCKTMVMVIWKMILGMRDSRDSMLNV